MIKSIKHKGLKRFWEKNDGSKLPASQLTKIDDILERHAETRKATGASGAHIETSPYRTPWAVCNRSGKRLRRITQCAFGDFKSTRRYIPGNGCKAFRSVWDKSRTLGQFANNL